MESTSVCNHTSDKQNRTTMTRESDLLITSMIVSVITWRAKLLNADWLRQRDFSLIKRALLVISTA